MNVGKAFTFVFEDPKWPAKLLVAAVFALLANFVVGLPFLLGYQTRIIRNVRSGAAEVLPEWSDIGAIFSEGIRLLAVTLVYALPALILACVGAALSGISENLPLANGSVIDIALTIVMLITFITIVIDGLAFFALWPAIAIHFADSPGIGGSFRLKDVAAPIRRAPGPYLLTLGLTIITGWCVGPIGLVALYVGYFVTLAYSYLVAAHLFGQLSRRAAGEALIA